MPHFNQSPRRDQPRELRRLAAILVLVAAGCGGIEQRPAPPAPVPEAAPAKPAPAEPPPPAGMAGALRRASWQDLPGWQDEDPALAWAPLRLSCRVLARQAAWREACSAALKLDQPDRAQARRFFELHFTPFQATRADGGEEGLITGYYEPLLRGSRTATPRYRYPVMGLPDDLLVVDLADLHPELKGLQLRGRLDGRRVVPYYDRAQIEQGRAATAGREIAWVDDPIELFFLQIQGSGRIALENGDILRVGYADQNGHPYRSIGRLLVDRGELPLEKASMQGIKAWARAHPAKVAELLNRNARYVFFRELPGDLPGPIGALGVPITARRSVAIDPGFVPLGAPVYVSTTWPLSRKPLNQLMLAQDTGGAIRGPIRADYFWGFGDDAAREAGRMKQPLRMWVLLPKAYHLPQDDKRGE